MVSMSMIEKQSHLNSTAALMVGIQTFDGMTTQDASAFANSLAQTLKQLRENDIPIVWMVIDSKKGNKALIPNNKHASDIRNIDELKEIGFEGFDEDQSNYKIFSNFIQKHGPRENEALFRKSFMSGLVEEADINHANKKDHQKALLLQAGVVFHSDEITGDSKYFYIINEKDADIEFSKFFKGEKTVPEHLRETNVQNTLIMGQVSYYCMLETAISAEEKGFNPTIIDDRCLSYVFALDPTSKKESGTCVWQGTTDINGNHLDEQVNHRTKLKERINDIISNEANQRSLSPEKISAIKGIKIMRFNDAMRSILENKETKMKTNTSKNDQHISIKT